MNPIRITFRIASSLAIIAIPVGIAFGNSETQHWTGPKLSGELLVLSFLFSIACNVLMAMRGYIGKSNVLIWIFGCLWLWFPFIYLGMLFHLREAINEHETGKIKEKSSDEKTKEETRAKYMLAGGVFGTIFHLFKYFTGPPMSGADQAGTMFAAVCGGFLIGYLVWVAREKMKPNKL